MLCFKRILSVAAFFPVFLISAAEPAVPFAVDPDQHLERTCFQTSQPFSGSADLRSDVAIAYGIDRRLPGRIQTWRDHGYIVHVMTGVAWGEYQDYLYGRFDGVNHEDEEQTDRYGNPHHHGDSRDVFYMCPGTNYGAYLCVGVQRALDGGAEAIHLEEPEFWVQDGYSAGFKREWRSYYGEAWTPPHSSVDAQWRASKLKYYLYRRALQQVFDYIQAYNHRTGRHVRCYVATHSLLNYSHWRIVSPESSLARLNGCDGYIAQVWTGTSRTPNMYSGKLKERTFETAFLEYGAMQNLVRATGRQVWYLNDPIEDNPNHDWTDYRENWESTLTASLFQPEVWRYEVAPWPERVFRGRYPYQAKPQDRHPIPPAYATELQTVMNALNHMNQPEIVWDCGTAGLGVVVSDSLMFQRGDPHPSDPHLSQVYGLALPLLKRGAPITPVQLENLSAEHYLDGFRVLLLTYHGMKPLTPDVHARLAEWVRGGGALILCDDAADPYNTVREWWNTNGNHYRSPLDHLLEQLNLADKKSGAALRSGAPVAVGTGFVLWLRENPADLAKSRQGADRLISTVKQAAARVNLPWRETNYLLLRRGPYVIAAGLDESADKTPKVLRGQFVDLFDAGLRLRNEVTLTPNTRFFLLDLAKLNLKAAEPTVLASACQAVRSSYNAEASSFTVEGVTNTEAIVLIQAAKPPSAITLSGNTVTNFDYAAANQLLRVRFSNQSIPRELRVAF